MKVEVSREGLAKAAESLLSSQVFGTVQETVTLELGKWRVEAMQDKPRPRTLAEALALVAIKDRLLAVQSPVMDAAKASSLEFMASLRARVMVIVNDAAAKHADACEKGGDGK